MVGCEQPPVRIISTPVFHPLVHIHSFTRTLALDVQRATTAVSCELILSAARSFPSPFHVQYSISTLTLIAFDWLASSVQETYGDFYLTDIYGQKNVDVIEAHDPDDGPLFLYSAFSAGHSPLQALEDDFADCSSDVCFTKLCK